MRLLYSFRFQQIGDTYLAAATGPNAHLFNGVLQLNEVGHFIVSELIRLTITNSSNTQHTAPPEHLDYPESLVHPEFPENIEHPEESEQPNFVELSEEELLNLLTDSLTKEYAVDRSTAQSAVQNVLDYLKSEQVIA